ncbi:carboxyl-terminal protease [Minicystis rosea]|nr:carboxyl-terminal protease [Minicystis rosea]
MASNRNTGMVEAFPDVCLTPIGGVPVPIPYLNVSFNLTAVEFPIVVLINCVNALNLGSVLATSIGDEPGVLHWTIKGPAVYVGGYPKLFIEGTPGACLLSPTIQNTGNAVDGLQAVPSATNVIYGLRVPAAGPAEETAAAIAEALAGPLRAVPREMMDGAIGYLAVRVFAADSAARVHGALRELTAQGARGVVIDLRGNPGGEIGVALDWAGDFLPAGSEIARVIDADGDTVVHRAHGGEACDLPLAVLVDHETASAAELFAGALQAHGRAIVVGATTLGKGTGQAFGMDLDEGRAAYASAVRFLLPGGRLLDGKGVRPDREAPAGGEALLVAKDALMSALARA